MNEVVDTGKCVICSIAGLSVAVAGCIAALALVLNGIKALLF
ncbi:MAG TPA: hypothetical protein VF816_05105 [Rhodocyclaceae bacterium]